MQHGFTPGVRYTILLVMALSGPVQAEVVLDGSMGTGGALSGPDYAITQDLGNTSASGQDLFHSFTSFNLTNTESATFSGDPGIKNIVSRVTGGSTSNINGLVRSTIPGANFYFINPAGVVFGPDAGVNVGGSFYAGTADYVALENGERFDAHNTNASTLELAPPTAFGFSSWTPAGIQVNGPLLQGAQSQTLSLTGGDIDIVDGNLYAPDGRVVLASVASPGEVTLGPASLSLQEFESLGTINVSNPSGEFPFFGLGEIGNLDVTTRVPGDAAGGGKIIIRGGDFFLADGLLRAEVIESVDGGGIDVKVRGTARLSGDSKLFTRAFVFEGDAGPVRLEANTITLEGDASIRSDAAGTGQGGTITVTADEVIMRDGSSISADALSSGDGGSVLVSTGSFAMLDDAQVKTSAVGSSASGDAGNVIIQSGNLFMSGDATINSSSELGSQGQAGSVEVTASNLQMEEAAWIISYTETERDAGRIDIDAGQMAMLDQSVVSTSTFSGGNGGTIVVTADNLYLQDTAVITSGTEGSGNAGNVIINAGNLTAQGDAILSSESEGGNFFVRSGADLSTASGGGDGGTVQVNADMVTLNGNASVSSGTRGTGAGGNVELVLTSLFLNGASRIAATSTGSGVAGDINVEAGNTVQLSGGAITTETLDADGGNIHINASQLVYLLNSVISTSVSGGLGDGGNITIDPVFVVLNNSSIIANAHEGNGGNILIVAENFFQDPYSRIEATSDLGIDGTIVIKSPDENVSSSLADMPDSLLAEMELASRQCDLRTRKDISSLVMVGRDGLPPSPDDYVAVRLPVGPPPAAKLAGNTGQGRSAHPVIRLGNDYHPGELLVLQCNPTPYVALPGS
jgi:filamentous hemagglutinin family protein